MTNDEGTAMMAAQEDLVNSQAYAHEPNDATVLWNQGFRPILAEDVRSGMVVCYKATDPLLGNPHGNVMSATVADAIVEDGSVRVRHDAGVTEADEYDEVWVHTDHNGHDVAVARVFWRIYAEEGANRCGICEERFGEHDDKAEMFDPTNSEEDAFSAIVHPECGLQRKWEVA